MGDESPARQLGAEASRWLRDVDSILMLPGLTAAEIRNTEETFGIQFPDDHRAFLENGLPVSAGALDNDPDRATIFGFPDWRNGDPEHLRSQIEFPLTEILEDVRHGRWPSAWGTRPWAQEEALRVAQRHIVNVPRLVPIYAHRYLPSGRGQWGHPVLSVYGSDVVYYGSDLLDYLKHEFTSEDWEEARARQQAPSHEVTVGFWKNYVLARPNGE